MPTPTHVHHTHILTFAVNGTLEIDCTVDQEGKAVRDTTGIARKSETQMTGDEVQHGYYRTQLVVVW